jgi:hypothetical protein
MRPCRALDDGTTTCMFYRCYTFSSKEVGSRGVQKYGKKYWHYYPGNGLKSLR